MKKVTTIIGTRPEIIKMSRVIPALDKAFSHELLFSSQHYDREMVGVFFDELGLRKPDAFLETRTSSPKALESAIYARLKESRPQCVVVLGDTNTTLTGTKAAKRLGIPVAHIEAGARSFDMSMPEERNRIAVDAESDYLFAHSAQCAENLRTEKAKGEIFACGNPGVDALHHFAAKAKKWDAQKELGISGDYLLLTLHRAGNVDKPRMLEKFLNALGSLETPVVFPVHPRTKKRLEESGFAMPANIRAIAPQGYFEFLGLLKKAKAVVTDSGGVQLETATLGIPCFVARQSTEYWEALDAGLVRLVGLDAELLEFLLKLTARMPRKPDGYSGIYGDGHSAEKIVATLLEKSANWK